MKAMVMKKFGGPEVLEQEERPRPQVKSGHMVVRVAATSVNPLDTKLRAVETPWSEGLPEILHGDVAGTVDEVGEGVKGFNVGDDVYGCAGGVAGYNGALAEYMLVDADLMALKPKTINMREAAALPLVALTCWEALIDKMKVGKGNKVLVHAATGGVGHIAIQLAKTQGAEVYATTSARKKEIAATLGADVLIDYGAESVEDYVAKYTNGLGFDAVFDTVAGDNIQKSFAAVRYNGAVATILPVNDVLQVALKGISFHGVLMLIPLAQNIGRKAHGEILRQVAEMVDNGQIKPLLDPSTYTIWEAAEAHRHLESNKAIGKIVLTV